MTTTPQQLVEQWRSEYEDCEDAPLDSRLIARRHADQLAAALAGCEEPVAWAQIEEGRVVAFTLDKEAGCVTPLYAAPQPSPINPSPADSKSITPPQPTRVAELEALLMDLLDAMRSINADDSGDDDLNISAIAIGSIEDAMIEDARGAK